MTSSVAARCRELGNALKMDIERKLRIEADNDRSASDLDALWYAVDGLQHMGTDGIWAAAETILTKVDAAYHGKGTP